MLTFFVMQVDLSRIRVIVEPILGALGFELVDLRFLTEHGRRILRLFVDREGGISVGDCQRVSREIETVLEVEGVVRERYDLEVSSPGLDRPLTKEEDFRRFIGRQAFLKTREAIEGRRHYKGVLKGLEEGNVVMEIDKKDYRIPLGLVERAHLVY